MGKIQLKNSFVAGILLALLSACAIQDGARTGLRAISDTDGAIQFDAPAFDGAASERVIYADTTERDEYALFTGQDRQAEIVYISTRHLHITNLVIDQLFDLERAIDHFRHNQNETPVLGEAFKFADNGIRYWGKAFQLPKAGKTCGAFSGSWDSPPDDMRSGKVLFGYYCEPGSQPLSDKSIQQSVAKVGIRGITANAIEGAIAFPVLRDFPSQETLKLRAQGAPGDTRGNTEFPYKVVRFFKREDSCRFQPNC